MVWSGKPGGKLCPTQRFLGPFLTPYTSSFGARYWTTHLISQRLISLKLYALGQRYMTCQNLHASVQTGQPGVSVISYSKNTMGVLLSYLTAALMVGRLPWLGHVSSQEQRKGTWQQKVKLQELHGGWSKQNTLPKDAKILLWLQITNPQKKIFGDLTLDEIPNTRLFRLKQRTLPWHFQAIGMSRKNQSCIRCFIEEPSSMI